MLDKPLWAGSLESLPCADKLAFESLPEADAAGVYARHRYGGERPRAYHCRYCGRWHLSTKTSRED